MERKGEKYMVPEVLARIPDKVTRNAGCRMDLDGDVVKAGSLRLVCFKLRGTACAKCGLVGEYFVKERSSPNESFHVNLYGLDASGREVLLTQDHVFPKSKGGSDSIANSQTLCFPCNQAKGPVV